MVNHAMHDHAKHFIPWVTWLLMLGAGTGLSVYASTAWSLAGIVVLLLIGTAALVWSVWETCLDRSAVARWHGVVTVAAGGLWLVMCTVTGSVWVDTTDPRHWEFHAAGPTIGIWAVLGIALACSWNTRINSRDRAAELAEYLASQNPEPTPMDHAGLPGSLWRLKRINRFKSDGPIILGPGTTYDDLVKKLEDLASAYELPPGSIKAYQPKGTRNARRVHTTVMHENPLASQVPWPGLLVGAK